MALKPDYDAVIIGGGAAGLMCAITAANRGRKTLIIDHNKYIGEKIRISGGGRCNFTNIDSTHKNFLSENPRFCISALKGFPPQKIIDLLNRHNITWHDKGQGQLFCDQSATAVISMLLEECGKAGVTVQRQVEVNSVNQIDDMFVVETSLVPVRARSLVIATGGLSIPKIGATGYGHKLARQFGHTVIEPHPGLVPLTFSGALKDQLTKLSGISINATVSYGKQSFKEALRFTHRGLSGPAILQISSYWKDGHTIKIDMAPTLNIVEQLKQDRTDKAKQDLSNVLCAYLPKRLASFICESTGINGRLADMNNKKLQIVADAINNWQILPQGTEGYRTAEVTLGGVNTKELSSKTMQSNLVSGLYFIGEVVDVTGQLGGHNFQWAWSSGFAAGHAV